MNPIYKFQLSANGQTREAKPVYKDDLAIDYALEQGEQFYRGKLSGKLTFQGDDYNFIRNKAFDTQFDIVISISYNNGATWAQYWAGNFWKTDCVINEDSRTVIVTPTVNDDYTAVLAGLDKEYNLLDLAPAIQPVQMRKRPCLQIYIPGNSSVGQVMFGNATYWETECESKTSAQVTSLHFGKISDQYPIQLGFYDTYPPTEQIQLFSTTPILGAGTINYGAYTLQISDNGDTTYDIILTRNADNAQWRNSMSPSMSLSTLEAVPDSGADSDYVDYTTLQSVNIYGRIIMDKNVSGSFSIDKSNDMVANNRNYHYCLPFLAPDNNLIVLSGNKTTTPTPYGLYQPGIYYDVPNATRNWIPIARNAWSEYSIWLNVDALQSYDTYDYDYAQTFILKDAYPIWSVISVLLGKIAPGITHAESSDYSKFLYDNNPFTNIRDYVYITPKSNLITAGYDIPAQKAPITLNQVLGMLKKCYRCYWFIDSQKRFRIEHILYFRKGGKYTGNPVVGINLNEQVVTRNGKPWSYARNQYEFDKPEMAARYQFGWMDDATQLFDGYPIDILSKYVNPENIEQIEVSQFSSDVDYILLNPSAISEDGFVLLSARLSGTTHYVPLVAVVIVNSTYILQNGKVSFYYLERFYYQYDMPAKNYQIGDRTYIAQGIKKLKRQTLNFPVLVEPNFMNLIKTGLGNGTIQKMSVNLSSRNANTTLMYDTE